MKANKFYIIIFLLTGGMFFSCKNNVEKNKESQLNVSSTQRENLASEELITDKNFKDNFKVFNWGGDAYKGGKKTVQIGDIYYSAAIMPKEYFIKKNLSSNIDSLEFYKEKLVNEEVVQFDFQLISGKDILKEKATNYETYIKYLSYKIKNDFYAITKGKDTIKPAGVFFERTYGMTPYKRLLLYFNTKKSNQFSTIKLVYDDKLFENGIIKLKIKK